MLPSTLDNLLQSCHHRDAEAQRQLYEHFYPFAISIALHYGQNRNEAEEIVQDAFLKLFVSLDREPFQGNFKKWFRRIIVNAGIDYYRKFYNHRGLFSNVRVLPEPITENQALRMLSEADCSRLLQQLSPAYRMVFNLHVIEGYSHPEIARELGISVGTSKSNLAKARRRLQKLAAPFFSLTPNVSHV